MSPGRADLAVGLVVLGRFYAVEWLVRRRPKTAVGKLAVDAKRAGRAARLGAGALMRLALAEGELLARSRRSGSAPVA